MANGRKGRDEWLKLDNAAKVFPANSTHRDAKVFRFTCLLKEDVLPRYLQKATEDTLKQFPNFGFSLRRGMFWYFFEKCPNIPQVTQENLPICSPLYDRNRPDLLFRVSYYGKRINLEVHHSITDGTGALAFLRTLLINYLMMVHGEGEKSFNAAGLDMQENISELIDDSFARHYSADKNNIVVPKAEKAYKIGGKRYPRYGLRVIEGTMDTAPILAAAKAQGATLTVFLAAVLMSGICESCETPPKKSVILSIPVNLRNFFTSSTVRNFFGLFYAGYNFRKNPNDLHLIIEKVKETFKSELTEEKLGTRMNNMEALERNRIIRMVPLFIKDFAIKIFGHLSESQMTAAFSNIGIVKLPEEISQYVDKFSVAVTTQKLQVCLTSFAGRLTVTFTSPFVDASPEMNFFRKLNEYGANVEITSNHPIGEEDKDALL